MQEVFKKIIGKLEKEYEDLKEIFKASKDHSFYHTFQGINKAIEIVKKEAEKYVSDNNVGNNGWIPCSERLPEEYGEYLCCDKYGEYIIGYPVERITDNSYYVETEHEIMNECIAWQPLPPRYQPKGEKQEKKITNSDRIRSMSDEELAEFILGNCENPLSQENDEMCDFCENFETLECNEDSCKKAIVKWLQSEMEE